MIRRACLLGLAAGLPTLAFSQGADTHYRCTSGELVRRVQILYETGVAVPCEVHYFKDSEAPGQREVLWRALDEAGYCEAQTQDFVERLEGLGWRCAAAPPPEPPSAAVPVDDAAPPRAGGDDTAVLEAGETAE